MARGNLTQANTPRFASGAGARPDTLVTGKEHMKNILSGLFGFALVAALAAAPMQGAEAKKKEKETEPAPKAGEAYSGSGTVTKNDIDICMVTGLRYWLHPKNKEEVRVYPKSKHESEVLDDAVKNKSTVHVAGTWKETVQCHYVETSKVEKVKK